MIHSWPITDQPDSLGEGPAPIPGGVRWVDIDAAAVWVATLAGAGESTVTTDRRALYRGRGTTGASAAATDGGLIVAEHRDLVHVDALGRELRRFPVIPASQPSRLNDGAVDPAGRYLVGSLPLDDRRETEQLVRLEADGSLTVLDDDLTISNGLVWSADGGTLYSIDSIPGVVWARDYDPAGTAVGPRRLAFSVDNGLPDGMAIDAEGRLWIAIWGAGEVRCYETSGRLVDIVSVAARHPTSCAFVGPAADVLVITSAGKVVDGRRPGPVDGLVYAALPGTTGPAPTLWQPLD